MPYPLSGSSPTGRANLTTVTQYSVVNGVAGATRYASRTAYDSQGNVRSVTDAEGRTITYNPWDNFGSSKPGTIGETHAMVSAVTDPAGFSNGVEYDWRSGLPKQSYHLSGSTRVNITNYSYDNHWRLAGVSLPNGGGFSRAYWDNWRAVATYSIVDSGKTRYSFTAYDGAGRTRWSGGDHPSGVPGRYSIQKYVYDAAGRTTMTSNVTAIDGNYIPTDGEQLQGGEPNPNGDGYRYTIATLDTLDRATMITRPDGQTVTYNYTGCGCAGGLQTFVTDESGRKRKQVYDLFGRLSEAYELQKNSTVGNPISYNKAAYQYNRFDQITEIKHYDGGSVNYQTRTFAYDGYARLQSQTTPEAGTVSYTYFNNDLIQTVQNQKPTGNTATFGYNSRNLLETISYNDGGATPSTTIQYDEYGARQSMTTTGIATVTYGYNSYHELSSETVNLNGLGAITLGYQFTLSGALKQISYSGSGWTKNVNYDYNYAGAPSGVGTNLLSGAGAGDTTNVINGLAYTSFGGVKNLNFGTNPRLMQAGYDLQRQQMTSLFVRRTSNSGTDNYLIDQAYSYKDAANANKNNGRLMQVTDYMDPAYTTSYSYDDYNRLSAASASAYSRSFTYDAWGNLRTVNTNGTPSETGSYTLNYATVSLTNLAPLNNHISGPSYDEAGNLKIDGGWAYTYDAANRLKTAGGSGNSYDYDGDGCERKCKSDPFRKIKTDPPLLVGSSV